MIGPRSVDWLWRPGLSLAAWTGPDTAGWPWRPGLTRAIWVGPGSLDWPWHHGLGLALSWHPGLALALSIGFGPELQGLSSAGSSGDVNLEKRSASNDVQDGSKQTKQYINQKDFLSFPFLSYLLPLFFN